MTIKEIIDGLKFTVDMFLFDPSTGETFTEPSNDMDKITIDACRGAIELLEQEPKTEWTPIEWKPFGKNGYPKPEDEYKHFLTIDDKGEITIQEFLLSLDEEPQPYFTGMRKVIAWMPLPTPYKAESEDKE